MEKTLLPVAARIGFLIIDEAHCISDWGHDFRPDYRRITRILQFLPRTVALLATTATANDRVVADLKEQIGPELKIFRGSMARSSLRLQVLNIPDQAERLAWLAAAIPKLPGSGIVYCLTVRDARNVSTWLEQQGIPSEGYWGSLDEDSGQVGRRERVEAMLLRNEIKVLVATTALGMGYDKPDLGFVIHFQAPGSVVQYYQQVGRAGRALEKAYAILLQGQEDKDINDYFIHSAFPEQATVRALLAHLQQTDQPLSLADLQLRLNVSQSQLQHALKLLSLESPSPVLQLEQKWQATHSPLSPHFWRRVERLTAIRQREQDQMREYARTQQCLMLFLTSALDDPSITPCGHCANCVHKTVTRQIYAPADLTRAATFLRGTSYAIHLKRVWPKDAFQVFPFSGRIESSLLGEEGRVLCGWGDAGWGSLVREGKYKEGRFADDLVHALADLIRAWQPQPWPEWVVPVPSLRHGALVFDFATRLALDLQMRFHSPVTKVKQTAPQKEMRNRFQQARNLDGAFTVEPWAGMHTPVLLVDDMVDSTWTLTVLAALLRKAGSGPVFPVALALSRGSEEG